jgi:hypothetical protein
LLLATFFCWRPWLVSLLILTSPLLHEVYSLPVFYFSWRSTFDRTASVSVSDVSPLEDFFYAAAGFLFCDNFSAAASSKASFALFIFVLYLHVSSVF